MDTTSETSATENRDALKAVIREALRNVYDPELGINIVDLGLVYDIAIRDDGYTIITMTLTTPGCPMHESIGTGVALALDNVDGVTGGNVRITFNPPWNPSMLSEEGRRELGYF